REPAEARRTAAAGLIDLALVLSPSADPSPALDLAADALRAARVPVATIAHGDRGPMPAVIRPGEAARAAVAALEPSGVPAMAQAVMTAAPPGLRLALARQLVGLIPVAGIVPKVAVAYAGTLAIGRAVVAWAAYGQALEPGTVRRLYRQALSHGKDVARALVAQARKRAPRRRWLRRRRG